MIPQLLPADRRALNRRRWSFRFSGLTTITTIAVGAWTITPDAWHPTLPEWSKYLVMGLSIGFALLANASHVFKQQSAEAQPTNQPQASQ